MRGGGYPGGATQSAVLHTNGGGYPPRKPPVLLQGGTRGHMCDNRSWGVGGISVNSFLIGAGGGYPPPADRAAVLLRGVTLPTQKGATAATTWGGTPPHCVKKNVLVVKEKRPSGTCSWLMAKGGRSSLGA